MGDLATGFKTMVDRITSDSKFRMAIVLHEEGKWQEAEAMKREVLEVRRRVLGEDHPDTLSSMEGLAGTVAFRARDDWQFRYSLGGDSHYGRLVDAINKLRTSVAAQRLRADEEHPHLLGHRVELEALLIQMNQEHELKEAEDLLLQAVPALSGMVFLLEKVDRSAGGAAAQDAAPTSSNLPSQRLQVVSEAQSGCASRSSDSSAWWEAALQQKLHERSKRVESES